MEVLGPWSQSTASGKVRAMTGSHETNPQTTGPTAEIWTLMTRAVARISPDATLPELATKLAAVEAGALAVGTTTDLAGIVSERDLVQAYAWSQEPDTVTVGDIASTKLVWCEATASALDAARVMVDRGVRHLLVNADGELQGIVSARDLIGALVR